MSEEEKYAKMKRHQDSMMMKLFGPVEFPVQDSILFYGSHLHLLDPWEVQYKTMNSKGRKNKGHILLDKVTFLTFYVDSNMDRNYEEDSELFLADTLEQTLIMNVNSLVPVSTNESDSISIKELVVKRNSKEDFYYYFRGYIAMNFEDSPRVRELYVLMKNHIEQTHFERSE